MILTQIYELFCSIFLVADPPDQKILSYYKKKAPKSYHFFILKDGESITSDTYGARHN